MTRTLIASTLLLALLSLAALGVSIHTGRALRSRIDALECRVKQVSDCVSTGTEFTAIKRNLLINAKNTETLRQAWNLRHNERVTFMVEATK